MDCGNRRKNMTVFTYTGWGERGSRFLTDLLRFMDNAGIINATQAADGKYIIETANNGLLRVGYSDSDEQIIMEVEQLVEGNLFHVLREQREVVDLEGAGMDRRTGKQYIETHEDLGRFITDLLGVTDENSGTMKIFCSLYGGTGSGFLDWVVEHIEQGEFLAPDMPDRPAIILDVGLPQLKTDNGPVRTENGTVVTRYDDLLDQMAELDAYAARGTVTTLTPKDNGLGLIAEVAHRNNMGLDQLRSITGPIRNDGFNWSAAADFLDTKVDLPTDVGVGVLNTGHLRAGTIPLLLRFDGSLKFREPQGGLRDRRDILTIATHNTAIVDSHAEVDRGQAARDEPHLERSVEHAVISATKRAVNKPMAGYSVDDVNMVQAFVATADGTPLEHLSAARKALVREFDRDDFYIVPTAVENIHDGHFVDGEQPDAAVWLRVGVDTVLPAYEALDAQL